VADRGTLRREADGGDGHVVRAPAPVAGAAALVADRSERAADRSGCLTVGAAERAAGVAVADVEPTAPEPRGDLDQRLGAAGADRAHATAHVARRARMGEARVVEDREGLVDRLRLHAVDAARDVAAVDDRVETDRRAGGAAGADVPADGGERHVVPRARRAR